MVEKLNVESDELQGEQSSHPTDEQKTLEAVRPKPKAKPKHKRKPVVKRADVATQKGTITEVPVQAVKVVSATQSDLLWEALKNKEISMFALPAKKVFEVFQRVNVDVDKLYLISAISSSLPALENAIGKDYIVEVAYKYITVSKKE